MKNPPEIIIEALEAFAPHFARKRTWEKAKILAIGAILTNGRRVVTGALRMMGLEENPSYNQYHHVLSRASWSALPLAQTLLGLVLSAFFKADEPLVFGIDETIERRWGNRIKARGIYRDGVRSSESHFVKTSGLRWVSVMLLTPITWAQRTWALPILTALTPSARFYEAQLRHPKPVLARALQLFKVLKRWWPERDLVGVGDGSYAALEFLHGCQQLGVTFITRLRLDAALCDPAPPYSGKGRPRKIGTRQPTLHTRLHDPHTVWQTMTLAWYNGQARQMEVTSGTAIWFHYGLPAVPIRWVLIRDPAGRYDPVALLCTDKRRIADWIVTCFVSRWQVEVTFEESRRHLGVESQRQWSDNAIARTTPLLLGLFSWITLVTQWLFQSGYSIPVRRSTWYAKPLPTFSDALALVRLHLWHSRTTFLTSGAKLDMRKVPAPLFDTLMQLACYAA